MTRKGFTLSPFDCNSQDSTPGDCTDTYPSCRITGPDPGGLATCGGDDSTITGAISGDALENCGEYTPESATSCDYNSSYVKVFKISRLEQDSGGSAAAQALAVAEEALAEAEQAEAEAAEAEAEAEAIAAAAAEGNKCSLPSSTDGYVITNVPEDATSKVSESDLGAITCGDGFKGTNPTAICSTNNGEFTLTGCDSELSQTSIYIVLGVLFFAVICVLAYMATRSNSGGQPSPSGANP